MNIALSAAIMLLALSRVGEVGVEGAELAHPTYERQWQRVPLATYLPHRDAKLDLAHPHVEEIPHHEDSVRSCSDSVLCSLAAISALRV